MTYIKNKAICYLNNNLFKLPGGETMKCPNNTHRSTIFAALFIMLMSTSASADESLKSFSPELPEGFMASLAQADINEGKALFERKCSTCHDINAKGKHNTGPNLWNVIGRKAGTAKGFDYSESMATSGHVWTLANLNYFLQNTKRAVPDLKMSFRSLRDEEDRINLLHFIQQAHD